MNKNSLPAFTSTDELVDFFDNNDMGDFDLPAAEFEVDVQTGEFSVPKMKNERTFKLSIHSASKVADDGFIQPIDSECCLVNLNREQRNYIQENLNATAIEFKVVCMATIGWVADGFPKAIY